MFFSMPLDLRCFENTLQINTAYAESQVAELVASNRDCTHGVRAGCR